MASNASLASRFSTETARISPAGGASSPNRLRSALLNGRCHAKPLPSTIHVRLAHFTQTVTPGRLIASASTSSKVIAMTGASVYPHRCADKREHRDAPVLHQREDGEVSASRT